MVKTVLTNPCLVAETDAYVVLMIISNAQQLTLLNDKQVEF